MEDFWPLQAAATLVFELTMKATDPRGISTLIRMAEYIDREIEICLFGFPRR